jgi:hypothetical protein
MTERINLNSNGAKRYIITNPTEYSASISSYDYLDVPITEPIFKGPKIEDIAVNLNFNKRQSQKLRNGDEYDRKVSNVL